MAYNAVKTIELFDSSDEENFIPMPLLEPIEDENDDGKVYLL